MANWRVCSRCDGKYLPSITSHPSACGICAPLKFARHSRTIIRPALVKSYKRELPAPDPKLPVGTNYSRCGGCGEYFGGVGSFDVHREKGACIPPSEVSDRQLRPVLSLNSRGYWVRAA